MNWLTNFVRPKIRALAGRSEVPENLWLKCSNCEAMIFHRELEQNLHVCQHCGFHMRLSPKQRFQMLFDDARYTEIELPKPTPDPLRFRDIKRYTDRLKEAQAKSSRQDAMAVAHGDIGGMPVVVGAFDFQFMGGSMGVAVGEAILAGARLAVLQDSPYIVITASGGARMQEGMLSLMQLPRTVIAVQQVKEAGLPYIVVLSDPTTGGVTASFAMLGDIHIAERGALIGFAGARVIEETIRETLPEGFQRAEYLREHGMVDIVVPRADLRPTLVRVLDLLCHPGPKADVVELPDRETEALPVPEDGEAPALAGLPAAQEGGPAAERPAE